MNLTEKVGLVNQLFDELDADIAKFQSWSTLHCKFGCGKCCFHPEVEATILEFLPFAQHLYQNGLIETWWERLKSTSSPICLILNESQSGAGLCSEYQHRGLICRLFGYSARTDKYNRKELVTCQIIKTEQAVAFREAEEKIQSTEVPVMSEYYMRLRTIDPLLTENFYPINVAMQKAIEMVMQYWIYR